MRCFLILATAALACGGTVPAERDVAPIPATQPVWDRTQAAHEAAGYLVRHLDDTGRFDYVRRSSVSEKKYNILRHAGSIHSLVQYQHRYPNDEIKDAILRAARYLKERYVQALPQHPDILAAVSRPIEESVPVATAKLGGTALALIALCGAYQLDPGIITPSELSAMGAFLLFMQKEDGSFQSKYLVNDTFDTSFHSLYYPGETMLALTMLYDIDGDERWLQAALRSASQLVESRRNTSDWPADHWMMLASAPLLERHDQVTDPAIGVQDLREHITAMAAKIIKAQRPEGHFTGEPRSTPASTRLEGLSALARIQQDTIEPTLQASIDRGLRFLMQCQLRETGSARGGMPRSCASSSHGEHRGEEIRIDYVQHYLSALLTAPVATPSE